MDADPVSQSGGRSRIPARDAHGAQVVPRRGARRRHAAVVRRTQNTSFRYHTTGGTLGFAVGMDARLIRHLSLLGDLTLDLGSPEALASTRFDGRSRVAVLRHLARLALSRDKPGRSRHSGANVRRTSPGILRTVNSPEFTNIIPRNRLLSRVVDVSAQPYTDVQPHHIAYRSLHATSC